MISNNQVLKEKKKNKQNVGKELSSLLKTLKWHAINLAEHKKNNTYNTVQMEMIAKKQSEIDEVLAEVTEYINKITAATLEYREKVAFGVKDDAYAAIVQEAAQYLSNQDGNCDLSQFYADLQASQDDEQTATLDKEEQIPQRSKIKFSIFRKLLPNDEEQVSSHNAPPTSLYSQ